MSPTFTYVIFAAAALVVVSRLALPLRAAAAIIGSAVVLQAVVDFLDAVSVLLGAP